MNILIMTEDCAYDPEIERLAGLFFEDARVHVCSVLEQPANFDAAVSVHLKLTTVDSALVAFSTLVAGGVTYRATATKSLEQPDDATYRRRRGKSAVMHALHDVLTQYTGEGQPWGVLTGVRPTKLAHDLRREGLSGSQMHQRLMEEHQMSENRAELLSEIVVKQLQVVPDLDELSHEVSVYVGIPFCPTHCAYCTFPAYSMAEKAAYANPFLAAMEYEIVWAGEFLRQHRIPVTSVYIGGGTPTSLQAKELVRLLDALTTHLPNAGAWREFSVEAGRPDTITPDRVGVLRQFGVNRISVNPQTFKASTLREIRRGHTPDMVDHRFHYVRDAGFDNINMDIILGLPGESLDDVRYTMERVGRLDPDAITVHTMSLKRSAVVKEERHQFAIPEGNAVRTMMAEAMTWARSMGHAPYYLYRQKDILGNLENVGFAKSGKESVYNILMMEERQTIVGIGGGAVTKAFGENGTNLGRLANPRDPKSYVETVAQVVDRKHELLEGAFQGF